MVGSSGRETVHGSGNTKVGLEAVAQEIEAWEPNLSDSPVRHADQPPTFCHDRLCQVHRAVRWVHYTFARSDFRKLERVYIYI